MAANLILDNENSGTPPSDNDKEFAETGPAQMNMDQEKELGKEGEEEDRPPEMENDAEIKDPSNSKGKKRHVDEIETPSHSTGSTTKDNEEESTESKAHAITKTVVTPQDANKKKKWAVKDMVINLEHGEKVQDMAPNSVFVLIDNLQEEADQSLKNKNRAAEKHLLNQGAVSLLAEIIRLHADKSGIELPDTGDNFKVMMKKLQDDYGCSTTSCACKANQVKHFRNSLDMDTYTHMVGIAGRDDRDAAYTSLYYRVSSSLTDLGFVLLSIKKNERGGVFVTWRDESKENINRKMMDMEKLLKYINHLIISQSPRYELHIPMTTDDLKLHYPDLKGQYSNDNMILMSSFMSEFVNHWKNSATSKQYWAWEKLDDLLKLYGLAMKDIKTNIVENQLVHCTMVFTIVGFNQTAL
jgi:hypothetical protein